MVLTAVFPAAAGDEKMGSSSHTTHHTLYATVCMCALDKTLLWRNFRAKAGQTQTQTHTQLADTVNFLHEFRMRPLTLLATKNTH